MIGLPHLNVTFWLQAFLTGAIALACCCVVEAQTVKDSTRCNLFTPPYSQNSPLSQPVDRASVAVKSNLLLDALGVPSLGVEVPVAERWSMAANGACGWWNTDRRHRYWRLYGADLEVRYWMGPSSLRTKWRALTGHHLGLYAQMFTYDFEFGKRGYMGGNPGENIFDKATYGIGLSYGYSIRLARRLNMDFSLGLGYFGGDCQEYHPDNGCYVYDRTRHIHWWGPTRAEVQLVWLLGRAKHWKGGDR